MRGSSWNNSLGEELRIGHYTVRPRRSLGEGGFAFIHLVEDVTNGRELVLKRANIKTLEGRAIFEKEASIMRSLAHPNIVQTLSAVELPGTNTGAILMEYCPRGHLLDALNRLGGRRMDEERALSIMCDVTSAAKYLHDKRITHRDIKLENILGSAAGVHKLCDFGSCVQGHVPLETAEQRVNEEEVVEKTTTQMYRAPEMVDLYMERELTEKVDVWALGCVFYAVCYLKHPFQDAGNLGILNARIRIPNDSGFSDGLNELILRVFCSSASYRPAAAEVEACLQALRKGKLLPPARNPPPPGRRETPGSTSSGGEGPAVAGGAGGGKNGASASGFGARGGRSGQVKHPSTPSRRSARSTTREPHLNPKSVAARRLACRKEEKEAVVVRENSGADQQHGVPKASPRHEPRSTIPRGGGVEHSNVTVFAVRGQGATQPVAGWPVAAGVSDSEARNWQAGVTGSASPGVNNFGTSNFADFDQFANPHAGTFQSVGDGFGSAGFSAFPGDEDPFAVEPSIQEALSSGFRAQSGREASFEPPTSLERTGDSSKLIDLGRGGDAAGVQGRGSDMINALENKLARAFPTPRSSSTGSIGLNQRSLAAPGSAWGAEGSQGSGNPVTGAYRPPPISTDFGPGVPPVSLSGGSINDIVEPTKHPFQPTQGGNSSQVPQLGRQLSHPDDTPRRMSEQPRSQSSPTISADGGDPPWLSLSESLLTPGRRSSVTPICGRQDFRASFPGPATGATWHQVSSGDGTGAAGQVSDPNWRRPSSLGNHSALRISRTSLSPMGHTTPSPSSSPSPGQGQVLGPRSSISPQQQQWVTQGVTQGVQHQQGNSGAAANGGPGGWSGGPPEGFGSSPGGWHSAGARKTSPSNWSADRVQQQLTGACQQQAQQQQQQQQQHQQGVNQVSRGKSSTQGP